MSQIQVSPGSLVDQERKMLQNQEVREDEPRILPEDRIRFTSSGNDLKFPTEEEFKRMTSGGTAANTGSAGSIPHPDELPVGPPVRRKSPKPDNSLFSGIPDENGGVPVSLPRRIDSNNPFQQNAFAPVKQEPPKSPELELILSLLKNCKKSDYEIDFKLNVRLPYLNFFDIFEDNFVGKNEDLIFEQITKLVTQEEITKQLEAKIREIYAVQS